MSDRRRKKSKGHQSQRKQQESEKTTIVAATPEAVPVSPPPAANQTITSVATEEPELAAATTMTTTQEEQVVKEIPEETESESTSSSSSSSSLASTTSILLEQLTSESELSAPVEAVIQSVIPARFVNLSFSEIERIVSNENAAELDKEKLRRVRETASRGFNCTLMEQNLQQDFPDLFSFTKEYTEEETLQHQPAVIKIQRLAILNALITYIKNSDTTKRELIINLIQANEVEAFCSLLQNNQDELGSFNVPVNNESNKKYSLNIIDKKTHKIIRQEAALELIFRSLTNREWMQTGNNMEVFLLIISQSTALRTYVCFQDHAAQLNLHDLGNLDKVFGKIREHEIFQNELKLYYEELLKQRKEIFMIKSAVLLDINIMSIDKINLLITLIDEHTSPEQCYQTLRQRAHELNMPDFPELFGNAVDKREFEFIQFTLRQHYITLRQTREEEIRRACAICSDMEVMARGNNRQILNALVSRNRTAERCHFRFKEVANNFGINNFSQNFEHMIDEDEKNRLQLHLRYQKMILSLKEKFTLPPDLLEENQVLQLRIYVNELMRSENIEAYLGIVEFDLFSEWKDQAKLFAYRALAMAVMRFRNCHVDTIEAMRKILTSIERCNAVYELAYKRHITLEEKGFTPDVVIGLAEGTYQVKHQIAPKAPRATPFYIPIVSQPSTLVEQTGNVLM